MFTYILSSKSYFIKPTRKLGTGTQWSGTNIKKVPVCHEGVKMATEDERPVVKASKVAQYKLEVVF